MTTRSNDQGRAYEYAWITVLNDELGRVRPTQIVENSSYQANLRAWSSMTPQCQETYLMSASSAVDALFELEPIATDYSDDYLLLEPQEDGMGIKGDVRDIVIRRDAIEWEIGLSIKHNHEAIKHSRLSHRLDFGNEWFNQPCSDEYWDSIMPIFDWLKEEKQRGTKWSEIPDKDERVYIPLFIAFMKEIKKAAAFDSDMPKKMVEYLIGVCDYYKIISMDNRALTLIRTFNLHGTLGQDGENKVSAFEIPIVELPTELIDIRFKTNSSNTVEMYLNNGWQLSFRIHNASTKVEPSLKFDVQFIGMPPSVLSFECHWR